MASTNFSRLTDNAKQWVIAALKKDWAEHQDPVVYEVSVSVFPDPSATEPLTGSSADPSALVTIPTLVLYFEIPGIEPKAPLYMTTMVAPFDLDASRIEYTVNRTLKSMREFRQELLDNKQREELSRATIK